MKRIVQEQQKFNLFRMMDDFAKSSGQDIQAEADHKALLSDLEAKMATSRTDVIRLYGMRTQSMFAFVAGALGNCLAIKEEDAGELYSVEPVTSPPDFRLITKDEREIFVEVKNRHTRRPGKVLSFKETYLSRLKRYASIFQRELFVCVYWSPANLWSLNLADDFALVNGNYQLSFEDAFMRDHMSILGDQSIGTTPQLTLKFLSDPSKPRTVNPDGVANFTIVDIELYCGDNLLKDDLEKSIAWFFMLYGDWPNFELATEVIDGELISQSFRSEPKHRANPGENFEFVGRLSAMIARQFNAITAPDGRVKSLSPNRDPQSLGVIIPKDFRSEALPLWRFVLEPTAKAT